MKQLTPEISFVKKGYENILKEIVDDWKDGFATIFEQTWIDLMRQDAHCSTMRSYMADKLSSEKYKPYVNGLTVFFYVSG